MFSEIYDMTNEIRSLLDSLDSKVIYLESKYEELKERIDVLEADNNDLQDTIQTLEKELFG